MSQRLGVFGGMFDPVHQGHCKAAAFALDALCLDGLKMVPCHVPNHREEAIANGKQRVRMLELATQNQDKVEIDTLELDSAGVSYMVETIDQIALRNKNASLVLVLGLDSFNSLPTWHRFSEMSQTCHLLVLSRPGAHLDIKSKVLISQHWLEKESAEDLFVSNAGNFYLAENVDFDLSSTDVRKAIRTGHTLTGLVDASVAEYISDHKLYQSHSFVK